MKTLAAFVALLVGTLISSGCASMQPAGYSQDENRTTSEVDSYKMALIEAVARERGVEVIWVHPPRKDD